jgi:hypothetical protein
MLTFADVGELWALCGPKQEIREMSPNISNIDKRKIRQLLSDEKDWGRQRALVYKVFA